jgi:hypothetical protein
VAAGIIVIPPGAGSAECTTTVSSVDAAANAVDAAAPGAVVCMADGTYGKVTLNATKAAPGVTLRAEHPGQATLAGASVQGSYLTVAQFRMTGVWQAEAGSTGMTADHNLFIGGSHFGVMAGPSTTTTVNDVAVTNNIFQGRFSEDAIRLNRYHDGPDADNIGVLIEGNDFSGNVEDGGHRDVIQSVWVGDHLVFRRNYLHDFGGQGFFVKDQASPIDGLTVEDNLIIRQNLPCDPASLCPGWEPSPFHIFGPVENVSIRHNTVWPGPIGGASLLRGSGWAGPTVFSDNVMANMSSDTTLTADWSASNNTRCDGTGFPTVGMTTDCSPAFLDPANGDYRQANGRGVTWRLADQHFGPTDDGSGGPTDPPDDNTPPDTTIGSGPSGSTTSTDASFAFASSEADSTFACSLDKAPYSPCQSPVDYHGLTTGEHSFGVRATDKAGNVDDSPATRTWTITTGGGGDPGEPPTGDAPPTVSLSAPASGARVRRSLTVVASPEDDKGIARVELWLDRTRLDSDDAAPWSTSIDASRLRDASHTLTVRAFDTGGNAVSRATRIRLVRSGRSYVVRLGSTLSSAPTTNGTTQLAGTATGDGVFVTLTRCTSSSGRAADSFPLAADKDGKLQLTYADAGMCVLGLDRLDE